MKRIVKYLCIITILVGILLLSNNYIKVKADSGWDTDFGSGGSFDSGSSWSSGSSHGNGSSSDLGEIGDIFIILIIFISLASISLASAKKSSQSTDINNTNQKEISKEEADLVISNFDIKEFNFKAYQIFYDVQMGWMNFDYDKLKELLTDELYNSYVMDLEALKIKNQRNTMNGFELVNIKLIDLKEENNTYIAKVLLNVKFYDYIEDINTKKVLRGTNSRKVNNTYILTFVKTKDETTNINKCPRCGAPVEGNTTGTCEYCKSKLINETYDWVMSKKEKISQR